MKKLLASTFAALLSTQVVAEPARTYAELFSHPSSILDENRQYSVHLPSSYDQNPHQKYPVLYLLDGENRMLQVTGIVDSFQGGLSPNVPEMIVVGIHNTNRMRDYTPTHSLTLPNGEAGPGYSDTGGGRRFFQYLTQELMPLINHQYRTAKPNILVGHSLGGLMTLDAIRHRNKEFQAYISIDPSLWFDYPNYYGELEKSFENAFKTPVSLYLAMANNPFTPGIGRSNFHRDHLLNFAEKIAPETTEDNLHFKSHYFENEDHHSVYHLAVYNGLMWLFDGYDLDITPGAFSFERVRASYHELNSRLHSELKPDREYLKRLEKKATRWPNMEIPAQEVTKIEAYFYPDTKL